MPSLALVVQTLDSVHNIYRVLSRISSYGDKVSQSTIFGGMFRFLGDTLFFYSNVLGVMLSTK